MEAAYNKRLFNPSCDSQFSTSKKRRLNEGEEHIRPAPFMIESKPCYIEPFIDPSLPSEELEKLYSKLEALEKRRQQRLNQIIYETLPCGSVREIVRHQL